MKCDCGSMMEIVSQFNVKSEGKDAKMPVSYKCPDCEKTKYKEYKS